MLFVLAFCLLAGAAGSMVYAYLIDRQETVNRIKIVENKTHIEEEFDPPADPGPGSVIKKKPCICPGQGSIQQSGCTGAV